METKIVLTGIARSKGKAAAEALVNTKRMGWGFNHVGNEDGTPSYYLAQHYGDAKIVEDAGGKIFHQTCWVWAPMRHQPQGITVATDSFKYCKLASGFGQNWIYGNPEALVNAAVTGVFTPTARWDFFSKPRQMRQANEQDRPLYDGHAPMIS